MSKILIVEDDPMSRQTLTSLLGYYGHTLLEAADGADALQIARREHPELIITDILMPTMDGYELVHLLRSDASIPFCPVIFCTAEYDEREARALAQASGVNHILFKPCEPRHIVAMIAEVLEQPQTLAPQPPDSEFSRKHKRVLTDKLAWKVRQLEAEVLERRRAEQEILEHQRKLDALSLELALAEERERDRIAGELHDQVGQRLILVKMKLDALTSRLPAGELENDAEEVVGLISQTIQDIRSLTFQIRPPLLAGAGLEAAVQWLGEELKLSHGLHMTFSDDKRPKALKYEIRSTVFQSVRELLLNVAKHAGTNSVSVDMYREGESLVITVSDNGAGFDSSRLPIGKGSGGGFGLFNVQQRIRYLGGSLVLDSGPGRGTRACITVPLEESREELREG